MLFLAAAFLDLTLLLALFLLLTLASLADVTFFAALVLLALVLVTLALPGKARQCALVFLPFLSTDDLRQVHVLFPAHAELLRPLH